MNFTKIVYTLVFLCSFFTTQAQIKLSAQINPGATLGFVKDADSRSSLVNYTADGETTIAENRVSFGTRLSAHFQIDERFSLYTGLWFAQKQLNVANENLGYYGKSIYNTYYLQLPCMIQYDLVSLLKDKMRIYASAGAALELKIAENLQGSDGAHYMNLAHNRTDLDPLRGANGANKKMNLFAPIDIAVFITGGLEYDLTNTIALRGGITFSKSLLNMINPALSFRYPFDDVAVQEDIFLSSGLVTVDLGVIVSIN